MSLFCFWSSVYFVYFLLLLLFFVIFCPSAAVTHKFPCLWDNKGILVLILITVKWRHVLLVLITLAHYIHVTDDYWSEILLGSCFMKEPITSPPCSHTHPAAAAAAEGPDGPETWTSSAWTAAHHLKLSLSKPELLFIPGQTALSSGTWA